MGTLTAGPCMQPEGRANSFIKATRKEISLISSLFKQDNSGGTEDSCRLFAKH